MFVVFGELQQGELEAIKLKIEALRNTVSSTKIWLEENVLEFIRASTWPEGSSNLNFFDLPTTYSLT